jgi:hypothetical protein
MSNDDWTMIGPNVRNRKCGSCTLCCTLLPVTTIKKPANTRCMHLCSRGCRIYQDRPFECRLFLCRWLIDGTAGKLRRPDKTGYVIDPALDVVQAQWEDGAGEPVTLGVIQVWMDPKREDAHEDPALRAWLDAQGAKFGLYALLRWGRDEVALLVPPSISGVGWLQMPRELANSRWTTLQKMEMLEGRS